MTVNFTASNQRSTTVWLELDSAPGASGSGQLNAGDSSRISSQEGETWVARDSATGGQIVAVYEVTKRVQTWNICPASTGLPVNLERFNCGWYSESLSTPREFLQPNGTLQTIFLFVDFDDVPAAGSSENDEDEIVGRIFGNADRWLEETSFGRVKLEKSLERGWRRMPKPAADYSDSLCRCVSDQTRQYLEDAAGLFEGDVDFSLYDIVCIVAAKTEMLSLSPAWSALPPEKPILTASGEFRHAICFGADSYDKSTDERLLLHETCHLFGLPDLYDGGSVERQGSTGGFASPFVTPWDLMADHRESHHLLGWHRLKLGWLDLAQVLCHFGGGLVEIAVTNLTEPTGIHSVMVPIHPSPLSSPDPQIDDYRKLPSQAYLVEVAPGGSGIIVYSVDASVPTWERPLLVRAGCDALQPGLLQPGETYRHLTAGLEVKVLNPTATGFRVAVSAS